MALVALVLRLTADPLGGTGVVSSTRFFATLVSLPANLLAFLSYLALTVPLVLPWAILRRGPALATPDPVGQPAVAAAVPASPPSARPAAGSAGRAVGGLSLRSRPQPVAGPRCPRVVLLAWVGLSLPVAFYIHFAPKYLVPSMPAIAVLFARWLCRSQPLLRLPEHPGQPPAVTLKTAQRVLSGTLIGGALLSLLIIHADAGFADLGRRAAAQWIAPESHAASASGSAVTGFSVVRAASRRPAPDPRSAAAPARRSPRRQSESRLLSPAALSRAADPGHAQRLQHRRPSHGLRGRGQLLFPTAAAFCRGW